MKLNSVPYFRNLALLIVAYIITAKLGLMLASVHGHVTPAWMPSGIALVALMLGGMRLWPGVLLGAFLANLDAALEPQFRLMIACGNTLEALAGAWLMRRFWGVEYRLQHAREALLLMVPAALGTAMIAACIGIVALRLSGTLPVANQFAAWVTWWLGDAVGIACAAPLLLSWYGFAFRRWRKALSWSAVVNALTPALLAAGVFFLLPENWPWLQNVLLLAVFPVAVWAALEGEVRQVALSNFLVAVVVIIGTRFDFGPFSNLAVTAAVLQQQGFGYAVALAALLLVSSRAEQRQGMVELARSQKLFAMVFANSPIPATISSLADGRVFEVNQAGLDMMHFTREQVIGRTTPELGVWRNGAQRQMVIAQMHENGRIDPTEVVLTAADGQAVEVLYSAQVIEFGGQPCVIATAFDLTARKRAEAQKRESDERFAKIFHASPDAIVISHLYQSTYLEANEAWFALTGYTREEIIGKRALEIGTWFSAEDRAYLVEQMQAHGRVRDFEFRLRRKDGSLADVVLAADVIELQGEPCAISVLADISARKRAEAQQRESDERFARIFHSSPDAIVISNLDTGVYVEFNDAWLRLCGYTREEMLGRRSLDLGIWVSPQDRARLVEQLRTQGRAREFEFHLRRKDGSIAETLMSSEIIELRGESCMLAVMSDVTDRKRAELQLRESERRFADVVEAAGEYVWESDRQRRYLYVSSRIEKVLGYPVDEVLGRSAYDFMPPEEAARVRAWFDLRGDTAEPIRNLEHVSITRDGRRIWQRVSGVPFYAADGSRIGFRGTGLDITERKAAEERIEELATRDLLTQLPNRRLMMDRLSQAILVAQRNQQMIGVLLFDLDRFKVINDSLGYATGDGLLKQVAARIAGMMTEGDTLARFGGDEFAVVLATLRAPEDAGAVAQNIIQALAKPFAVDGRNLDSSVTVGISVYPNDAADAATLIRNADMAMSFAKEHRRQSYQYFSPQMNARAVEKLSMESTLKRAIESEEFELYYHPKFSLVDGHLTGAEALLRWRHPQLGLISPAQFIPIAEETGLIGPLGEWVLRQGCAQARAWRDFTQQRSHHPSREPLSLAINLSVGQLNRGLARSVHNALYRAGLEPRFLELEVTESLLMAHADDNIDVLRQISDLGVKIAIDDFGTGYSSLAYLRRFHIDTLKIDQSFVRDVETSLDATAIITAVVALGHSLKLTVIAEGVETEAQKRLLAELNCDECQGFLFSEPLPAAEFEARFLRN